MPEWVLLLAANNFQIVSAYLCLCLLVIAALTYAGARTKKHFVTTL